MEFFAGEDEDMGMGEERHGTEADSIITFLKGLHVLAVDDDHVSLMVLEALLRDFNNRATMVGDPVTALHMLREGSEKFDLVISGVFMTYKDGFKLLKIASHEMDLPVIILSAYEDKETMIKWISLGACGYWVKPVCSKQIMNIWQHVVRKKKFGLRIGNNKGGNVDADEKARSETADGKRVLEKSSKKYSKNGRNNGHGSHENKENVSELSTQKKPRMIWSNALHKKFVEVVHLIGVDKAVPKKIQAMMGVDYISRESVASHLQKYRLHLKRYRDNTRMNRNPLDDASERCNCIWNKPGSFNHCHEHERYGLSAGIASSNPTSLFTGINHPTALGARGALVHGNNMVCKDVVPVRDVRHWPNDKMMSDTFTSCHCGSGSSYANILRGKLLETNNGEHGGNFVAYRSNVGMPSPINRFPIRSSSRLGNQPSVKRNPFGDIGNCLGNSRQAATKFPGLGNKDGRESSLGSSQANLANINQLAGLATSSVGQTPMCHNELWDPIADIMSNITNMPCTYEKTAPFDVLNNNTTSSAEMLNGNFALGDASSTSFVYPDLQMGTSVVPAQMLNGGGADGVLPMQEDGTVHLESIADHFKYIDDSLSETDVPEGIVSVDDNMPNEDFISIYDYLEEALAPNSMGDVLHLQ